MRHVKTTFSMNVLFMSIALCGAMSAHALEAMSDQGMASVTGKDGIHITTTMDNASIDKIAWEDETNQELQFNGVNIIGASNSTPVQSDVKLNIGSNASEQSGISAELVMSAMTLSVDEVAIETKETTKSKTEGVAAKEVLGKLAFKTSKDTTLRLDTSAGLFNEKGKVNLELKLDGADIFLTDEQASGTKLNQLILSDTRLHAKVSGKLYVSDTEGLVLEATTITLVADGSRAGLQAALMLKGDITEGGDNASASKPRNFTRDGAKGLIRIGASGQVSVTKASIRGFNANASTETAQDSTLSVLGEKGLAISVNGEFKDTGSAPLSFDLSEAGSGGYGIRFSELKAFNPQDARARYSLGNTYLSMLNVNQLSLPATKLRRAAGNRINGLYVAKRLATTGDFTYSVPTGDSIAIMTRGVSLQGVPQKAQFIKNDASATGTTANQWSLAPMVYDLNANMTITDGGEKILETARSKGNASVSGEQFDNVMSISLGLTTQGVNETDTNPDADIDNRGLLSTSILLIDTSTSEAKPLQTYVGFRNIDSLLTAHGDLGISEDSLIMNFSNFNLAFSGELAAGALPTKSTSGAIKNRFNNQNDTLTGLRGRINAEYLNVELKPGENTSAGNFLGFEADLKLNDDASSFVHLVDTVDSTTIGLDELKGRIRMLNGRVDITPNESVNFKNTLVINPLKRSTEVLEVGALNFYPSNGAGVSEAQRLGGAVITGGKLDVDMKIKPVNSVPSFP